MKPEIRWGTVKDLEDVAELARELYLFHSEWGPMFEPGENFSQEYIAEATRDMDSGDYLLVVASNEGRTVGYADAYIWNFPYLKQSRRGFLSSTYVLPDYRNKGIATGLLREVDMWYRSKSIQFVELNVAVENSTAFHYWTERGFVPFVNRLVKYLG